MTEARHEFGRVSRLQAEAIGQPGSRRFRLVAESRNGGSAVLWMEKEQLFNLAVAIKRLIATVEEQGRGVTARRAPSERWDEPSVVESSSVEFQLERLAVGYDEASAMYLIAGYGDESKKNDTAEVSLVAAEKEMDALADEAFAVCAAGRPRCFLCGAPMGPEPHVCPRHNGHKMPQA